MLDGASKKQRRALKYDFNKLKENIVSVSQELNNNQYYYGDSKEYELSKVSSKLINLIKCEKDFKDIFDSDQMVVLTNSGYTLSNYDVAKNSILNTLYNGIDDTIEKLNKLFSNNETVYSFYTLLGIKINKEYQISKNIKLIPINQIDSINQFNKEGDYVTRFKDKIIKNAYSAGAALVLTDTIKIEKHYSGKTVKAEKNKYSEIELIALLIGLQTKTGCIIFEHYNRFGDDCIISQPENVGLSECRLFPNGATEVDLDISEFTELLSNVKEFLETDIEHLKRILTMFTYACMKRNYIDSCLELRIILEAVFVYKSRGNSTYTYLICERGQIFLEKDKKKGGQIYSDLKDLYNLTSRVIHGNYKYKQGDEEKIKELKEYCHKSIIKIIKNKKIYKKMIGTL